MAAKKRKLRLLLDCDGILADFVGGILNELRENELVDLRPEDFPNWEIFRQLDEYGPGIREFAGVVARRPGFCLNLPVYAGAKEGVQKLLDAGVELFIVTSPLIGSETWAHERDLWLAKNFGIPSSRVVHTQSKHIVQGDVFVDDKAHARHRLARPPHEWCSLSLGHSAQQAGWKGPATHLVVAGASRDLANQVEEESGGCTTAAALAILPAMHERAFWLNFDSDTLQQLNRLVAVLRKNDLRKRRRPISREKAIVAVVRLFFLAHASSLDAAFLEVLNDEQQQQQRKHRGLGPAGRPPLPSRRAPKGAP